MLDAGAHAGPHAAVALVLDEPDAGVAGGVLFDDGGAAVGASVVDDEQFAVGGVRSAKAMASSSTAAMEPSSLNMRKMMESPGGFAAMVRRAFVGGHRGGGSLASGCASVNGVAVPASTVWRWSGLVDRRGS